MNKFDSRFRDSLINTETTNSQLQDKYRKELEKMLKRKIEGWKLWAYVIYASLCLGIGLRFIEVGFSYSSSLEIPLVIHRIIGSIGVFLLFNTGLIIWIICKGKLNLIKTPIIYSWFGWFLAIWICLILIMNTSFGSVSVTLLAVGTLVLFVSSVFHINQIVRNNGLKTKEKLLEIELRLAELSEKINK